MWPFSTITRLRRERDEARTIARQLRADNDRRADVIGTLQRKMAEGHWRNPKTGRLGKKGEQFS